MASKNNWIAVFNNRPFYSYVWNRGWSWPCFDTNLPALSCKSSYSYANQYFSRTISITKQRRFASKQGHRQPHIHSKARVLSPQLKNGLLLFSCSLCCLLGNLAQIIEYNLLFDKDIVLYFEGLQELGLCFFINVSSTFPIALSPLFVDYVIDWDY